MQLVLGYEVIRSYKRLSYREWTALAEFVDNSLESYRTNQKVLDKVFVRERTNLTVRIDYKGPSREVRIEDNGMGMSIENLRHAMHIGAPPVATTGLARYGMGLKTAASWFGDQWTITTSRLGDPLRYTLTVDVEQVAEANNELLVIEETASRDDHYTVLTIKKLNKPIAARTQGKVKQYLASIYRQDLNRDLTLWCFRQKLGWDEQQFEIRKDRNGRLLKKRFRFTVSGKKVKGWAGILKGASRAKAGFTIVHAGRVLKGWPEAWRPEEIFGQVQGSNDVVNQRLVGEVYLDDFEVSHTKDNILWIGNEESLVGERLAAECADLISIAKLPLRTTGMSARDLRYATNSLQAELVTPEFRNVLTHAPNGEFARYQRASSKLLETGIEGAPDFTASAKDLVVNGFLATDNNSSAPYAASRIEDGRLVLVLNTAHPYVHELDRIALLDHLRHTVFEALAQWRSDRLRQAGVSADVGFIKDRLFRIPALMRQRSSGKSRR